MNRSLSRQAEGSAHACVTDWGEPPVQTNEGGPAVVRCLNPSMTSARNAFLAIYTRMVGNTEAIQIENCGLLRCTISCTKIRNPAKHAVQERYKLSPFLRLLTRSLQGVALRPRPCNYNVIQPVSALSRRKRGFKSRRGRQINSLGTKCLLSVEREDHKSPEQRTPDDLKRLESGGSTYIFQTTMACLEFFGSRYASAERSPEEIWGLPRSCTVFSAFDFQGAFVRT